MLYLSGCTSAQKSDSYCNAGKSISVDFIKETAYLYAVNFYDSLNDNEVKSFKGEIAIMSKSFNTTTMLFNDKAGNTYAFTTDKELYNKPDVVKLYTNSRLTTFDTYKRKK